MPIPLDKILLFLVTKVVETKSFMAKNVLPLSLSLSLSKTNISQDDHPQHNIHCRV